MSFGALAGVLASLGLTLIAMGFAFRLLRRWGGGMGGGRSGLRMEVVDRVGLGPRQGLAVVRIGERIVVVAVGEGGVRPVLELDEEERAALEGNAPGVGGDGRAAGGFKARLQAALRTVAVLALLVVPLLSVTAPDAAAQGVGQAADTAAVGAAGAATQLFPRFDLQFGDGDESELRLTGTVGAVVVIGLLTLLPTLLLLMTSFTRILVVLHLLRQAIGTQTAPPAHLIAALALLLTGFVMAPTLSEVNQTALTPWMDGAIEEAEMLRRAVVPFREFMLQNTRERDLATFLDISRGGPVAGPDDVPLVVLASAFATSELRSAFQIGFALFLPFIVIDLVVASVLMSMGMFMLPPVMVSLPFKLLLFVLVDGWSLVVRGLVSSFH